MWGSCYVGAFSIAAQVEEVRILWISKRDLV
jgi:hypothetical protein